MNETHFKWEATFNLAPDIKQFDNENENMFSLVEAQKDILKTFKIIADNGEYYSADLIKGEIDCNGKSFEKIKLIKDEKPTLVYSRRKQVRGDATTGQLLSSRTIHRIGIKTSEDEIVIEAFPGLGVKEKSIKVKTNSIEKDITAKM